MSHQGAVKQAKMPKLNLGLFIRAQRRARFEVTQGHKAKRLGRPQLGLRRTRAQACTSVCKEKLRLSSYGGQSSTLLGNTLEFLT